MDLGNGIVVAQIQQTMPLFLEFNITVPTVAAIPQLQLTNLAVVAYPLMSKKFSFSLYAQ